MTCCENDEQSRLACEKRISANEERIGSLLSKSGKGVVEFALGASVQDKDPLPDGAGRALHVPYLCLGLWIIWIYQECNQRCSRHKFVQQLESLCFEFHGQQGDAGYIPSRSIEAGDEANLNRVGTNGEDDRNRRGCVLCC